MNNLLWFLLVFGITIIFTKSFIFRPIRIWMDSKSEYLGYLSTCPMCFSFWVGLLLGVFGYGVAGNCIFDGFIASGITTLLSSIIDWEE